MLLLNYRPVLRQPTGIGVYANGVLQALLGLPHVLIPGGEEGTAQQRLKRLSWTQFEMPRLAKRHGASLIFTPAPEGYLGSQVIPQVVMVHDLRPISYPERSLQSMYFRAFVPPLLRKARHVLTNSRFTARQIQRCTGLSAEKITVIPLGYETEVFRPAPLSLESKERPYLLNVGQAYPHKNLKRLIHAFAQVVQHQPCVRLVLAGKPHANESRQLQLLVAELGLQHRVEFRPYVPYTELPDLYRGALALVYPSLYEGFGLPVLEAMACGTPVITSEGSGTEEVAGDAALLVDPVDVDALRSAILDIIYQQALRDQCRIKGLQRASQFNWEATGVATRNVLAAMS